MILLKTTRKIDTKSPLSAKKEINITAKNYCGQILCNDMLLSVKTQESEQARW